MSRQSFPTGFMPKRTLLLLALSSFVLFILSFTYFVFVNNNHADSSPYYKASDARDAGFTTITQKEVWSKNNLKDKTELLAKETIEESFTAQANNLGIIAVPFNTHDRSVNDKIVFRLKETGKSDWYFQSTYNADQFQNNIPFPFGFPIIRNSKNISYTFGIESLKGAINNSVSIAHENSHFFTKYKFSKAELLKNPKELVYFFLAKTREQSQLLTPSEIVSILFFFLSPFIIYRVLVFLKIKLGLGIRKKIFKKIYLRFPYLLRVLKHLTFIKKIHIFNLLDKEEKIKLCSLIICVGFFMSITFHYFQGAFFKQLYPINSFIPNWFFGDFFGVFDEWTRLKFTGVGYGLSYFPGTYLIVNLFTAFFASPYIAVFVYLSIFTIFMFIYTYKNVKTNSTVESLQNAFIISLMSYPFLFAFQTANLEIITFISVSFFFIFYARSRTLSIIFLAYAISMKVFPGIFIVLLLLEKRYKDIFLTCIFTIVFTLLPIFIFDGGFNKGIDNYITHLKESQKMYFDLMIMGGAGNHYGHSLLNGLRVAFPWLFRSLETIMLPYQIFILIISVFIFGYLVILEKTFWKKVAILVMMMNLFPFTSTDYKLLYIFLPLFFLINYLRKNKYDSIFIILFSLLLIPKDYVYFNNYPMATLNVISNPIIMLAILLLIIFSGILSNLRQIKYLFNTNRLLNKIRKYI